MDPSSLPSTLARRIHTPSQPQPHPQLQSQPEPELQALPLDSNHRRRFFEQMELDFHSGLSRSQAVSRLRQRIDQFRASRQLPPSNSTLNRNRYPSLDPPSSSSSQFGSRNLVDVLHQVRSQRDLLSSQLNSHHTYLLYCGSSSDQQLKNLTPISNSSLNSHHPPINQPIHPSTNSPEGHRGCGRLITVRATPMSLKPSRGFMYDDMMVDSPMLRRSASEHLLLTSDSLPLPDSVERLDDPSMESFESDPSNPFHRGSPNRIYCSCPRVYVGCLSCGNVVGHTVLTRCRQCHALSITYPRLYYLNRLTAIPRYMNGSIALDLQSLTVPNVSSDHKLMSWTEALLLKQKDIEAGYVGINNIHNPYLVSLEMSLADKADPLPLSEEIRNAILRGSDDYPESLVDDSRIHASTSSNGAPGLIDQYTLSSPADPYPPASAFSAHLTPTIGRSRTFSSNSPSHRSLSSTSHHHRLVRVGLSRRPAVRISDHLGVRSGASSRLARLRSSSSSTPESWPAEALSGGRSEDEEPEGEPKDPGETDADPLPRTTPSARRPRVALEDDGDRWEDVFVEGSDDHDPALPSRPPIRRVVRRRIQSAADRRPLSRHHSFRSPNRSPSSASFSWIGDVCAR